MSLTIVHVELKDANSFIAAFHRHHKPVVGHRFSIGVEACGSLVGVVVVGRPVARMSDQRNLLEVTRLCTNGEPHACSALYAAAARAGKDMGYHGIQTFILASELGTSLKAAGWLDLGPSSGGDWNRPSRGGRRRDQPEDPKRKYGKALTRVDVFGLLEGVDPKALAARGD